MMAIIIGVCDVKIFVGFMPGIRIYRCDFKLCGFTEEEIFCPLGGIIFSSGVCLFSSV